MDRKIVVGVDGSEGAKDAIRLAEQVAALEGADVLLVAAFPNPLERSDDDDVDQSPSSGQPDAETEPSIILISDSGPAYTEALARRATHVFAQARTELSKPEISAQAFCTTSPAEALLQVAAAQQASAIVIGSTHRGRLGRVLLGGTGERILYRASCPVFVAPRGFAGFAHIGLGMIGVGYIDTDEARVALHQAQRLARLSNAKLKLITGLPVGGPAGSWAGDASVREQFEQALSDAAAEIDDVEVETALVDGDPAMVLADEGLELDTLVIGSRGYGPLRRVLLGGVSEKVMRMAPCPVVVTPRRAEEPASRDAAFEEAEIAQSGTREAS